MSTFPEQPFTDFEERYFLAEILKKSSLPTAALLNLIRDSGVDPAWTEIALPNGMGLCAFCLKARLLKQDALGRSLSSCQHAYQALVTRNQQQQAAMAAPMADPTSKRLKRTFAAEIAAAGPAGAREIQPRPPAFSTVNGSQTMTAPAPITMSPIEPPRKKRGRPTKSEFEKRQAEARERGEVWPKPRKPKTPRTSMEGVEATGASGTAATPASAGAEATPEGSQRTPSMGGLGSGQAPTAVMFAGGSQSMAVPPSPSSGKKQKRAETQVQPASQVQHEEMRAAQGGGHPEAHFSEFQASSNLLADFRQHPQMAGSPHLQQAGSPPQMQSPYGSAPGQFQAFPIESRPPDPPQQ